MGHTPGPWIAHGWGDDEVEIVGPDDRLICALAQEYDDHSGAGTNAAIVADARLIAAAPGLLAALKDAYDALDYAQAQVDSDDDRMHLTRCRRKIKPIITQAEGGDA